MLRLTEERKEYVAQVADGLVLPTERAGSQVHNRLCLRIAQIMAEPLGPRGAGRGFFDALARARRDIRQELEDEQRRENDLRRHAATIRTIVETEARRWWWTTTEHINDVNGQVCEIFWRKYDGTRPVEPFTKVLAKNRFLILARNEAIRRKNEALIKIHEQAKQHQRASAIFDAMDSWHAVSMADEMAQQVEAWRNLLQNRFGVTDCEADALVAVMFGNESQKGIAERKGINPAAMAQRMKTARAKIIEKLVDRPGATPTPDDLENARKKLARLLLDW